MPASTQGKILVACPRCGHQQAEPRTAISTICKKCRGHFLMQEALNPTPKAVVKKQERRQITCFDCGTELEVALNAESTMCKRCSHHVDLRDYRLTNAVSKNFKTKGTFVVDPKGYVFNAEAIVGEAIIKGRFHGKLTTERSLTIFSTAEIKGTFKSGCLVIPAENHFRWKDIINVGSADISGELAANMHADGTVVLRSTARLFGDIEAGGLVVEEGAVLVGQAKIGKS